MIFFYYAIPMLVGASTGSVFLSIISIPVTIFLSLLFMPLDKVAKEETKESVKETLLLMAPKTRVVGSEEYNRKYMGLNS